MSIPEMYSVTKIYEFNDPNPLPLVVDTRFKNLTIVVQPLNILDAPDELTSELLTEDNSVHKTDLGLDGTVTIEAKPPKTVEKYTIGDDSTIILTEPHTLSTGVPIHKIYTTLSGLAGCTHIAISVMGYSS